MAMKYGELAFLIGLVLALVVGLFSSSLPADLLPIAMAVLVLLGIVVGLLNVKEREAQKFLIAVIALLAATSSLSPLTDAMAGVGDIGMMIGLWIKGFLGALAAFIAPAAFVVALKMIYDLAQK